jgi:hypothetical protein
MNKYWIILNFYNVAIEISYNIKASLITLRGWLEW